MKTRTSTIRSGVRKPKPRRQSSATLGLPTVDPQPLAPQGGWSLGLVVVAWATLSILSADRVVAAQQSATFDVPATVLAVDVTAEVLGGAPQSSSGSGSGPVAAASSGGSTRVLTVAGTSSVLTRSVGHRTPTSRFYLLSLEVNAVFQEPQQFEAVTYEIMPLSRRGQIVDYSPRTQTTTDWSGEIVEESTQQQNYSMGANLQAGHPVYGTAALQASANGNHNRISRQAWKAPLTTSVTSGLSQRGRGVFFRLTPNRDALIEGGQVLQMVLEVPATWRGDLLQVHCAARGPEGLVQRSFLTAVAVSGDDEAQAVAERFAAADYTTDQLLRRLQVQRRPTHLLAEIEASLSRRGPTPAGLDPQRVRQSLMAAMAPEQVAHFEQLPRSVQTAVEGLLSRKREQVALAYPPLNP